MIKINLISEGRRPVVARRARAALGFADTELGEWLFLGALLLGILVAAGYFLFLRGEIKERERQIAAAEQEVKELEPIIKEVQEFKKKKADLEHKIEVINNLKQNQRGPVRIMDQISRAVPDFLWLNRMTLRSNRVELRGAATNTNQVATFLENINAVPEFQEPFLSDASKRGRFYNFVLSFRFSWTQPESAEPAEAAAGG